MDKLRSGNENYDLFCSLKVNGLATRTKHQNDRLSYCGSTAINSYTIRFSVRELYARSGFLMIFLIRHKSYMRVTSVTLDIIARSIELWCVVAGIEVSDQKT